MNNVIRNCRSSIFSRLLVLIVVVLPVLVAGCADVNRLREAQDAFNQAAAAENALRLDFNGALDDSVSGTPAAWSAARTGYASALLSLDKLSPADEKKLRDDGLWGTALTLKAMSQWRLGQFSKALATAAEVQASADSQIYPRDRAVLTALPGLIKTDQAYQKIFGAQTLSPDAKAALRPDVEALLVGDHGAIADIQRGRDLVDAKHPVQIYLLQAQLAAYRNFMVAQDRLNNHATVPANHPARTTAVKQLKTLDKLLKERHTGPEGQQLVNYWAQVCVL